MGDMMIRVMAVSAAITTPPQTVENVMFMLARDLDVKPPYFDVGMTTMEPETGSGFTGPDKGSLWMAGVKHLDRFKPIKAVPHHIVLVRMKEDGLTPMTVFANARAVTVPTEQPTLTAPQLFEFTFDSLMLAQ
jgi:hypothetical protein